jgi:hypothetical protein
MKTEKSLGTLFIFAALIFSSGAAWACEACQSPWDFDKSAEAASLVIVGQKVGQQRESLPEWSDVRVQKTLKGTVPKQVIRVRSWYGMCSYGIVVDDKSYVMLLVEPTAQNPYYNAVNYGCSVKTLPVEGDSVSINRETVSLEKLTARLAAQSA